LNRKIFVQTQNIKKKKKGSQEKGGKFKQLLIYCFL
jgi:hypothetical protein